MSIRLRIGDLPATRCVSWTHEIHSDLTRAPNQADPRTPGRSRHDPFVVTRTLDPLSPYLASAASQGSLIPEVRLEIDRTTEQGVDEPWFRFTLRRVYVVHWVTSLEDGAPLETITLDYGEIRWDFLGQPEPHAASWEVHPSAGDR